MQKTIRMNDEMIARMKLIIDVVALKRSRLCTNATTIANASVIVVSRRDKRRNTKWINSTTDLTNHHEHHHQQWPCRIEEQCADDQYLSFALVFLCLYCTFSSHETKKKVIRRRVISILNIFYFIQPVFN